MTGEGTLGDVMKLWDDGGHFPKGLFFRLAQENPSLGISLPLLVVPGRSQLAVLGQRPEDLF